MADVVLGSDGCTRCCSVWREGGVGARAQRKVDVSRGRSLVWGAGSLMTVGTGAEDVASHRAITLLAADLSNAPRADRNAILGLPPPPVSNVDHQSGTVLRKTTRQVLHVDAQLRQMTHPRLRVTLLCLSIPTLVSGHFVQLLFVTTVTSRRGKICTIQPHRRGLADLLQRQLPRGEPGLVRRLDGDSPRLMRSPD